MYTNMGKMDRLLRLIIGAGFLFLPFGVSQAYLGSGVFTFTALLVGGILVLTSVWDLSFVQLAELLDQR